MEMSFFQQQGREWADKIQIRISHLRFTDNYKLMPITASENFNTLLDIHSR